MKFPFPETAYCIVTLFNKESNHQPFVKFAHCLATELSLGATLDCIRSNPAEGNLLPWKFLVPSQSGSKLAKFATRFLVYLYVDHLGPEERKGWLLRHVDWTGLQTTAHYRTRVEFAAWYFGAGQTYKNSKKMCVDAALKLWSQPSRVPQLPPTQQAAVVMPMTMPMNPVVAQQLAFAPLIVPPVPVAPAPVQYIHQSCDEKQQATDCAPFIECQSAPSPAMGFAPEEQRTDTDVDQYIRSPLTPSRGPAFPMTVPSYQVAAAADDFQPSVASPMGANDMPSLEALANEPQYLLDNLDEWMQC
eukprot:TRINITY_DN6784_c0_g1_i1.p1 TRINITY_DN6784_c0_g1~~TRINITY_DN6784_c0_g1_i1.p1  ORF type:complete len:303 (-),score=49.16 TRINITY_DN6784_c0_g1_i1:169-1077(-)